MSRRRRLPGQPAGAYAAGQALTVEIEGVAADIDRTRTNAYLRIP